MTLFTFLNQSEGKRQKKKGLIIWFFFFFWINWSYFTMSLLYWDLILEALSFYEKKFGSYFKKIRPQVKIKLKIILGFIKKMLGPYQKIF